MRVQEGRSRACSGKLFGRSTTLTAQVIVYYKNTVKPAMTLQLQACLPPLWLTQADCVDNMKYQLLTKWDTELNRQIVPLTTQAIQTARVVGALQKKKKERVAVY